LPLCPKCKSTDLSTDLIEIEKENGEEDECLK